MRAFIIRPFGTKEGVDFNAVDEQLIDPALRAQHDPPEGRTTGEIVSAGNIRTDMFEQILTADLVIADVSIHNANVFYELGIRHALRDKKTVLIRSRIEGHEVPFDLKTDRYIEYDHAAPADSVDRLTDAIRQTIAVNQPDSPVFALMPNLKPLDPKQLLVVPPEFSEEVARAAANKDAGRLRLLAEESGGLTWEVAGLRLVGKAQFGLRDWNAAKTSLEAVTKLFPSDVEANTLLGTVHQRLDDLPNSLIVIERVLQADGLTPSQRAEARALAARNLKAQWEADWRNETDVAARQVAALTSGHLEACVDEYAHAFVEDRNHTYSGLNALAMLQVTTALAAAHPDVWDQCVDDLDEEDDEESERVLKRLNRDARNLAAAVELAIDSGIERLRRERSDDLVWEHVSQADLRFLTSRKPTAVAQRYRKVLAGQEGFVADAARKQIEMYRDLGIFEENTAAALEAIGGSDDDAGPRTERRVIMFTGHRLDAPDRPEPRFPAEKEDVARRWIYDAIVAERERAGDGAELVGISGGASGGDILFHEVCAELEIPSEMYLAVPQADYIKASVADGGSDWVRRFNDLHETTETSILNDETDLPPWLRSKRDYNIWQRSNLWMLHTAFARGDRVVLIALWNQAPGDGAGGTQDMVERANDRGARVEILDARELTA